MDIGKYELTGYADAKRVFFFNSIGHLDIRHTDIMEELPKEKYTVNVNMMQNLNFQYNAEKGKFYMDYLDEDRMEKQNDEMIKLTEGKTPEEAKVIIKDLSVDYIKRHEIAIFYGADKKNLADMVNEYIKYI